MPITQWNGDKEFERFYKKTEQNILKSAIHTRDQIVRVITRKGIVDTGLLRSSIGYATSAGDNSGGESPVTVPDKTADTITAHVGTRTHYAPYIEFGHLLKPWGHITGMRNVLPRPFIRPGFEEAKKKILKFLTGKSE